MLDDSLTPAITVPSRNYWDSRQWNVHIFSGGIFEVFCLGLANKNVSIACTVNTEQHFAVFLFIFSKVLDI